MATIKPQNSDKIAQLVTARLTKVISVQAVADRYVLRCC